MRRFRKSRTRWNCAEPQPSRAQHPRRSADILFQISCSVPLSSGVFVDNFPKRFILHHLSSWCRGEEKAMIVFWIISSELFWSSSLRNPFDIIFEQFSDEFWSVRIGLNNLFMFSKLREARSRLYRRQILRVNIRWKALDEIYKIYMLLHRSDLNISEIFVNFFCNFFPKFCKISFVLNSFHWFLLIFWWNLVGISPII